MATRTIDIHGHYLAAEAITELRGAAGAALGIRVEDTPKGPQVFIGDKSASTLIHPSLPAVAERIEAMDKIGLDVQVIAPWMQLNGYHLPIADGEALTRLQNDTAIEMVKQHSDRFVVAAGVPLYDAERAAEELARVAALGVKAVEVGTHVGDRNVDAPEFTPFWEAAEELGILVMFHPYDPPGGARLDGNHVEVAAGMPSETTISVGSILLGGLLERFPTVRISLPHGGGFLPYQIGRFDQAFRANAGKGSATRLPSEMIGRFLFDTILGDVKSLQFLVNQVGADRVVLGSDYPFAVGDPDPIGSIRQLTDLDAEAREAILGGNLAFLLD